MDYGVEDLPQFGVMLVPPSAPEFAALAAEIQTRIEKPVTGSPPLPPKRYVDDGPGMILRNRATQAIAALAWVWTTETADGRRWPSYTSMIGGGPSLLAPFGLDDRLRKLYGYWHTVLPGSKRLIRGNQLLGDNSDVRPPREDEIWKGGFVTGGGLGGARLRSPVVRVTLALDGVFFLDGGFAGPDLTHGFDRVSANVNAHLEVGRIAREGHSAGLTPAAIFDKIEAGTGPGRGLAPPPRPPRPGAPVDPEELRRTSLQDLATQIAMTRQHGLLSDDRYILMLMSWADTPVANLRRL